MSWFNKTGHHHKVENALVPDSYSPPSELKTVVFLLGYIRLNLLDTPFVDDFTSQHAPDVGQAVARWGQLALDIVDSFAEDNPYRIRLFTGDNDFQDLTAFRLHLDLFFVHLGFTLLIISLPGKDSDMCDPSLKTDPIIGIFALVFLFQAIMTSEVAIVTSKQRSAHVSQLPTHSFLRRRVRRLFH